MDDGIPHFLTIQEASRLLRIGRTKAYDLAKEWRATDGRSGLPVVDLGDVLRVPGPALRQMLGTGLAGPVPPAKENGSRRTSPGPASPSKPTTGEAAPTAPLPARPRNRRQSPEAANQLPLFEPLPFPKPNPQPTTNP